MDVKQSKDEIEAFIHNDEVTCFHVDVEKKGEGQNVKYLVVSSEITITFIVILGVRGKEAIS